MLNLTRKVFSILGLDAGHIPIAKLKSGDTPEESGKSVRTTANFKRKDCCLSSTVAIAILPGQIHAEWIILLICAFLLFIGGGFFAWRHFKRVLAEEKSRLQEQWAKLEKEKAEILAAERNKIALFQNIFREARVPLATIDEPVNRLLSLRETGDEPAAQHLLSMIKKNSSQLLKLSDQILDFEKLENNALSVNLRQWDIIPDVKNIVKSFYLEAQKEQTEIAVNCPYDALIIPVDNNKLKKIIVNLIANAFKRTPQNGRINIEVGLTAAPDSEFTIPETAHKYLKISVIDEGENIPQHLLDNIFSKPYKPEDNILSSYELMGGNIGLYYAYRLIELQGGSIFAKPRRSKGMVFSFVLPLKQEFADEAANQAEYTADIPDGNRPVQGAEPLVYRAVAEKISVLIIEHDQNLQEQLANLLTPFYDTLFANNGQDGLDKTLELLPDLIVCNASAPTVNGHELCDQIKTNGNTSHIPVLLLISKSSPAALSNMTRADMYVDLSEINLLPKHIEKIRARMQDLQNGQLNPSHDLQGSGIVLNSFDQKFIDRLCVSIDKDISKPELNVNALGRSLGFSRTSFYRKVKALTGQTPNDFLRLYRLKKSAELIKEGEHSLSEIGELTGFGTHSHFSTCFKKYYGVSPRNYRQGL